MRIVSLFCKIDDFFLEYEAYITIRLVLSYFIYGRVFRADRCLYHPRRTSKTF